MNKTLTAEWDGVDLVPLLTLEKIGTDRFRIPYNESNSGGEIFGGQYLGQAMSAALATGGGRAPHAMHAFFLQAARANRQLEAEVERVRDGRSFAHRRVHLLQDGKLVFCADVSLHDTELDQPQHQIGPSEVPSPEVLSNLHQLVEKYGEAAFGPLGRKRILPRKVTEVRPINQQAGMLGSGTEPRADIWMRAARFAPQDDLMHFAALAYLSDYWVNSACRVMHSRSLFNGETTSASLNHSIWFHGRAKVEDWLLYLLDSPSTHGGTGFNRGLIYDRKGNLLASTAQEALVRNLAHEPMQTV
ncbi:acyl-CoA thioesterase [Pseudomonas sp. BF-R-19]|uniref:acyl-CoA thioesterase n=1 Tax=Pseudomonas sp. BF-R-19 TaxID=2832397 RepID=UPI001CBE5057|nr:acyl-CoA thioesterase domain-containing protein [Pseudomonas sp. BF-R-19]